MPLLEELKPKNNSAASYFPVSANSANNKYDWETVVGFFIKSLHSLKLEKNIESLDDFKKLCKTHFTNKLDGEPFWHVIEKMYFDNEQVLNIAPEMQVLKVLNPDKSNSGDERLTSLFNSLMGDVEVTNAPKAQLNFLEQEVKKVFDSPLVTNKNPKVRKQHIAYLPFLSAQFQQDLKFLVSYPEHFLQNIKAFLKLYGFLYTAQLSLNIKGWAQKPEVKPCYFILDSEKASKERTKLQLHGHKQVIESSYALFPYLALNESLQDTKTAISPLWQLMDEIKDTDIEALNSYANKFYTDRNLTSQQKQPTTIDESINHLTQLFVEQFKKGTTRETAFNNFVKATRETLIKPFEQNRRRAGSFLVLNQDYLLLLANLCIGGNEKLRLHELLIEFQKRGVFFDKSSEECLIDLFERMGNVERMSDSGDAVYVKKTI
ncbi:MULTISPECIES: DNA phosphorothioation-dependent restriction protein DptG [unclassified Pseudoalteromonas]|uniref:DNA phosphorothioation-dependent restriction protein DptG n=1 Tax=unclassified Pseudoalteromonas TaxID=194690 RepID=UPI0025B350CF|nr:MULTISPECIES: DNA phosphorothioation-dependent restriction protein DptG [unclassified Pseudoalteromonas]MDN3380592.1 DNA phosphorothioation-dependent restriction protein DptG [Pseudoalteromonas sp. APC 3893]MDN3388892.1 DNA phosphorothioation-dependent restriction protein DptG [Pseudoalteromonas sp. APC 4017]